MESEKNKTTKENKKWIWIAIVFLAIAIVGVVSFGFTSGKAQAIISDLSKEEIVEVTLPLDEFLINLDSGTSVKKNFLKIELSLHSSKEGAEEKLSANVAQIRDSVISVLRKKTEDTVFKEEENTLVIKKELIEAINNKLDEDIVDNVFITNIVTQ
ncbi:flagellar basal body-associated protein Fl iL [Carnobacterium sp. 17-4]|uniref:flagellar basal body-associated FliL family protein n=1 Tax=Carnobacterium sp. (strain 17-4) TaxID=208596 RepID=UPI0002058A34|nr:flagellar basal body-associated FliL family protein [Carnobacterium sp. 17-4]AEB30642.1 flagellar basal body-associated protein Fl iL [Carnobacterium sp. 17-4]